mmetsp:Transcript_135214/g.337305  ORF Transcript_135214/g.337305 Transcript_135214/m.337305 type:complete len:231 (+) Transcript_135214:465-1157(+)
MGRRWNDPSGSRGCYLDQVAAQPYLICPFRSGYQHRQLCRPWLLFCSSHHKASNPRQGQHRKLLMFYHHPTCLQCMWHRSMVSPWMRLIAQGRMSGIWAPVLKMSALTNLCGSRRQPTMLRIDWLEATAVTTAVPATTAEEAAAAAAPAPAMSAATATAATAAAIQQQHPHQVQPQTCRSLTQAWLAPKAAVLQLFPLLHTLRTTQGSSTSVRSWFRIRSVRFPWRWYPS